MSRRKGGRRGGSRGFPLKKLAIAAVVGYGVSKFAPNIIPGVDPRIVSGVAGFATGGTMGAVAAVAASMFLGGSNSGSSSGGWIA